MNDDTDKPTGPAPTAVTVACGCNYTIDSDQVVPQIRYSVLGSLTLVFGITAHPKRVDYVCTKCGKTIDRTVDPSVLKSFTA